MKIASHGTAIVARRLLWFTLMWNTVEGVVGVAAGLVASSVALTAFGLDSGIEVIAAAILIWRLADDVELRSGAREEVAQRVVGATFLALAAYIVADAIYVLSTGKEPSVSAPGLALATASLVVMPLLAALKRQNGARLGSPALLAEAAETLFCGMLALAVFVGLLANALFGWWWADVAAALVMVPWIVKEGIEGIRAEDCEADG